MNPKWNARGNYTYVDADRASQINQSVERVLTCAEADLAEARDELRNRLVLLDTESDCKHRVVCAELKAAMYTGLERHRWLVVRDVAVEAGKIMNPMKGYRTA
jgi:hypothetical protein